MKLNKDELSRFVDFYIEHNKLVKDEVVLELNEESDGHIIAKIGDNEEDLTLYT